MRPLVVHWLIFLTIDPFPISTVTATNAIWQESPDKSSSSLSEKSLIRGQQNASLWFADILCIRSLRCKESESPHAVTVYMMEPQTCQYILGVTLPACAEIKNKRAYVEAVTVRDSTSGRVITVLANCAPVCGCFLTFMLIRSVSTGLSLRVFSISLRSFLT